MVMLKIYSDIRILGTMLRPAARLLACPPVCWLPLSAGLVCSPAACVSALAIAQRPNPPAQLYDVELLPPRAQGPNLSAHVCVMWQLVAPHRNKHVIKQVLVDGPALPLLPMGLRRDGTVETIPPTVDTLCPPRWESWKAFLCRTQPAQQISTAVPEIH